MFWLSTLAGRSSRITFVINLCKEGRSDFSDTKDNMREINEIVKSKEPGGQNEEYAGQKIQEKVRPDLDFI